MAVRELTESPSLRVLYPKAAAGLARPVLKRVPGLGGGGSELPDLTLVRRDVRSDREHLKAYDRVCGFRLTDRLPATYPHIVAFPMAMELMIDGSFPFGVIGLVHVENRIEQRRPVGADETLDFQVSTADLRPHDRGTQFDVLAEARAGGEIVWRSTSTYLSRGGGSGGGSGGAERRTEEPPQAAAFWDVPGDIGRRYAAVSGDSNPIHLHRLSARLFGFRRPIAHGMWLKARCLAALDGHLADAFGVDVRFKLPLAVPARVAFSSSATEDARDFAVHDARTGKPHLTGSVRGH